MKLLALIMSVFLCTPFAIAAEFQSLDEFAGAEPDDGIMALASSSVYPTSSSSGQAWCKSMLENYPKTVGYLYARTGNYEYTLWVGGEYKDNGSSVTVSGATRYIYTYHYYSGSSSNSYVTVSKTSNVNDTLSYTSQTYYAVNSSLAGFAALREGGNTDAQTLYILAIIALAVLWLPLYALIGRRNNYRGD